MAQKFIQWRADTSRGLGVNDQIAGAPVGIYPLFGSAATLIWSVDLSKNVILLDASGNILALDFKGGKIAPEVPLVLSEYKGAPTKSQQWSFTVRPGYITSLADKSLVVDDKLRGIDPGNPVWAFGFNGSIAQQWIAKDPFEIVRRSYEAA
ncbi:hypothetical protein DPM33_00200 [Mesorhizobium hawassense]|uniref:Ricin B lectin domain-containing protein n=1 Tax=Mesorhizobium hawassense TaxID=1209954 RepID=A0A330HUQ9_9HYPH|nr:RICIN domain-containing protein [Mesorhizobium hawassense]RAZ92381.1 hypothetical protein DPM33_00200 [Mesorhizobium hawassense]